MRHEQAKLEFRPYARVFKTPLQTHHGKWSERRGILLRLERENQVSWGEIVPLEAFGTESTAAALNFCQALPETITLAEIQAIPDGLPACQFGFEAAWESLHSTSAALKTEFKSAPNPGNQLGADQVPCVQPGTDSQAATSRPASLLLPSGNAALESPLLFQASPVRASSLQSNAGTFKWKIGTAEIEQELKIFEELLGLLPAGAQLRLDANGGLTWQQASLWLQVCDGYGIEFLEQPLPPPQLELMLKLSQRYATPIALDESVTGLAELKACYEQGWRGIFVIKAAIAGSPGRLRRFCQAHSLDLVWSSVFETKIARQYCEDYLIAALPSSRRANGFGVDHWFSDGWERLSPEQIWQRL